MHNHKGFTYALLVVIGLCLSPVFAFAEEASGEHVQPHVALVFGSSTTAQDDASFITAVTNGTREAAKACDMAVDIYTQDDKKPFIFLRRVMTEHPDVVIAVNFQKVEPLIESIEANPNTKFIVIDGVIPPFFTNAKSIIFREHEGSFLVGVLAALKSQTGKIGFIGGQDIPLIRNFAYGYWQGVQHVRPELEVLEDMVGSTPDAWNSPEKARELAKEQYAKGADVIFAAAGASGMGVLRAAEEEGKFAIGVDTNQNGIVPGHVLTSMVKKVDVAMNEALHEIHEGKWKPGILNLGLKENAIGYALDDYNRELITPEMQTAVEAAKTAIIDGAIHVRIYQSLP